MLLKAGSRHALAMILPSSGLCSVIGASVSEGTREEKEDEVDEAKSSEAPPATSLQRTNMSHPERKSVRKGEGNQVSEWA